MKLPWDEWFGKNEEIETVAYSFILANCYHSHFAKLVLQTPYEYGSTENRTRKTSWKMEHL